MGRRWRHAYQHDRRFLAQARAAARGGSSVMTPTPQDGGPLAVAIRARRREAILRGDFAPGERLREVEIAARHDVSRGPVREALLQLEQEGLVILRRNRGAVVARMSRADLEEVYSLRLAL